MASDQQVPDPAAALEASGDYRVLRKLLRRVEGQTDEELMRDIKTLEYRS